MLRSAIATFGLQLLEDGLANETLLTVPHVVFGQSLDEWLIHELHRPSTCDFFAHVFHQPVGHVLEHHGLKRERGSPSCLRALHQRAPAQRLDCLQDFSTGGACAQIGDQLGDRHRLALNRQHSQDLLLDDGAARELPGQQTPDATKDRSGARLRQERTDVAAEHLLDALADHLERQPIPTESVDQIGPILRVAREVLVG